MTQTTATIKAAIVAKLVNGTGLTDIKKWFNSEPAPNKYTTLFGFVEWVGGEIVPEAGQKKVQDNYDVVIALKSANSDENEDAVIALCMAAEALLDSDPTFGGTTFDSWVSNRVVAKYPMQTDYELAAVKLTVTTWRYKA